jgi:phage terminase large subunit GpA-like protein
VKTKSGKYLWEKYNHPRNEALDCRVYARAALWTLGVAGWRPERWLRERNRRGIVDAEIVQKEQFEARKTEAVASKPSLNAPKFAKDEWFGADRGNLRGDW